MQARKRRSTTAESEAEQLRAKRHKLSSGSHIPSPAKAAQLQKQKKGRGKNKADDGDVDMGEVTAPAGYSPPVKDDVSLWIEANRAAQLALDADLFSSASMDIGLLTINERIRMEAAKASKKEGQVYPVDAMEELKATMQLHLYNDGFAVNAQNLFHPYSLTTEPFLTAIDNGRMPPDLMELLDEVPCYYYDGCLVVDLLDYRACADEALKNPICHRVLLKPSAETLVHELKAIVDKDDLTTLNDRMISAEEKILRATSQPICLEPGQLVARVFNRMQFDAKKMTEVAHYTRMQKYRDTPYAEEEIAKNRAGELQPTKAMLQALDEAVAACDDGRTPHSLSGSTPLVKVLADKDFKNPELEVPVTSAAAAVSAAKARGSRGPTTFADMEKIIFSQQSHKPATSVELKKRTVRFERNSRRSFIAFEVDVAAGGGYFGKLRMGDLPDTGNNGSVIRFSLRDVDTVNNFLKQLATSCLKEGSQMVFDSLDASVGSSSAASASSSSNNPGNSGSSHPIVGTVMRPVGSTGQVATNAAVLRRGTIKASFQPGAGRPEFMSNVRTGRPPQVGPDGRSRQVQYNPSLFRQQLSGLVQQNTTSAQQHRAVSQAAYQVNAAAQAQQRKTQ